MLLSMASIDPALHEPVRLPSRNGYVACGNVNDTVGKCFHRSAHRAEFCHFPDTASSITFPNSNRVSDPNSSRAGKKTTGLANASWRDCVGWYHDT
jgi:hypothetical protein